MDLQFYMRINKVFIVAAILIISLMFVSCQPADTEPEPVPTPPGLPGTGEMGPEDGFPAIGVHDQEIQNGAVVVNAVENPGGGWLVIYADDNGSLGPIIGFAPILGSALDVRVDINVAQATDTLHAVLHEDRGMIGEFEYPGPDIPVQRNGEFVIGSFNVSEVSP
jgi:hypothetical protein